MGGCVRLVFISLRSVKLDDNETETQSHYMDAFYTNKKSTRNTNVSLPGEYSIEVYIQVFNVM